MGNPLPKPVESGIIERQECRSFRVGVAEVNGWRNSMEDAHLIHTCVDWGFFGVFDGHGGDQCSTFVAKELKKEISARGCPADDEAIRKMIFGVDKQFLSTGQSSGSTGTMCIVHRPASGSKIQLRLANVGDSRTLLGRRNGTIVDGGGTDKGLTTDHKPDNPNERQRIYRCGGYVVDGEGGGPARVNGELSVSRCFGDASFKETGGPGPEDRPVTANPELSRFECDEADFLLLVCDGVSEGSFPNADVVKFVAQSLEKDNDPGAAALGVCHKAIECNSKDNITCMVVLFQGSNGSEKTTHQFIPGNASCCTNKAFLTAYEAMAKKAGLTLAQAVEMRYEQIVEDMADPKKKIKELKDEVEAIGTPAGTKGSKERSAWFRKWEDNLSQKQGNSQPNQSDLLDELVLQGVLGGGVPPNVLASLLGGTRDDGDSIGSGKCIRRIRAPDAMTLRKAVRKHPALDWDERMTRMAGTEGEVQQDDDDGTSKVNFPALQMSAWLPTNALIACPDAAPDMGRPRGSAPALQSAGRGARVAPAPRPASDQCLRQALANTTGPGRRSILPRPDYSTGSGMGLGADSGSDSRGLVAPRLPSVTGRGRTPSPGEATAGVRMAAGGGRASSPLDAGVGSRRRSDLNRPPAPRVSATTGHRGSRSMPP